MRRNQPHRVRRRRERNLERLDRFVAVAKATLHDAKEKKSEPIHELIIAEMPRKIKQYESERDILVKKLAGA